MEAACSKTPLVDNAEVEAAVHDAFVLVQQAPSLAYSPGASRLSAHVAACALPDGVHLDGALPDEVLLDGVHLNAALPDVELPDVALPDETLPDVVHQDETLPDEMVREALREDAHSKEVH
jgi:hypothetical protein